ncbi:translation initiation factor eif-2b subunit family protein [Colletotrichum truncatum]|uniref:Translation initiation factor eif-2b subunit family protein n=1 Tax=Colletotrichum truncatum TaxID=5467 RepID=A0ACC3ZG41_COLTU|nr:translation initiation factor eif-2b subunit family protein [Colletotrichum truncatum]KAF6801958.1 translation initiation factor eif-2b subunit family protein [Colletotrichum truncatum]
MDSGKKPMTRRIVVSSFIFKFPPDSGPQVALFRRSDKVRTYQHRLAPVSGSVDKDDPSPLDAAWREINEETGLTPATLTLLRKGKDYRFADESIGREWVIHPFAFRLKSHEDEARIKIDWEHTGFQWFDPREVRDVDEFGGVPKLAESLRRVWFEIELGEKRGEILNDGLVALQRDHESGARQLAGKALDVLVDVMAEGDESLTKWWRNTRLAAWHLWKNVRESMGAAILNVIVRSLAIIEQEVRSVDGDEVSGEFLDTVKQRLREYAASRDGSVDGIWRSFEGFLRGRHQPDRPVRVLTLSSSSTILECLQRAIAGFDSEFDVRILESRPLFEGVSMASRLVSRLRESGVEREKKVNVSIYTDAAAAIASEGVDLVLIGADLIDKDGSTSNKTGSLPAVLSARHCAPDAKVLVLAENEKILPYEPPGHEENDIEEVVASWRREDSLQEAASTVLSYSRETPDKGLKASVRNVYFEWVPERLIDGYMFEDGQKSAKDISELAGRIRCEADAFFADV